jgi:hypothetical protein
LLLGAWPAFSLADEPAKPPEARVARLIRELGAAEYVTRERADAQLERMGDATRGHLQEALLDDDLEVRLRARRLLDRLRLDDLFRPAIVHHDGSPQPASRILQSLAAQSGNHIHIGDPYGNFADRAWQEKFGPTSYWEAVDEICIRTANRLRPHYDMHTPGIVVSAGTPPKYPRAYGGPVRGQITGARRVFIEELNYEEEKAELTHSFQINMQFTWEDRFRMVGYATQPELVEAVTDNHVIASAAQPAGGGWNATTRGLRQVTASLKLNPIPVSAKSFAVFTVRWGLIAVGEPAILELTDVAPAKACAGDDVVARIDALEKQPTASKYAVTLSVTRDLAMPDPQEVIFQEYDVEMIDGQGRAFRQQSVSPSLSERGVQLKLTFIGESPESEPERIKLHYPRLRARRNVELTFRNVPLPVGKPE